MDKLLTVGLGNYPKEYENTRHNIGFNAIDLLSKELNIELTNNKFNGIYGYKTIGDKTVYLAKPYTFMNLSGEFIQPLMNYFKIEKSNLLVICDDVDTEFGKFRIRKSGSSGGQNGLKSIINHLGTEDFKRIRVGIGRPTNNQTMVSHVLAKFNEKEREILQKTLDFASKAVIEWIDTGDFERVISKYTKK